MHIRYIPQCKFKKDKSRKSRGWVGKVERGENIDWGEFRGIAANTLCHLPSCRGQLDESSLTF